MKGFSSWLSVCNPKDLPPRYPTGFPVDAEASWPKCLLVDAEGPFDLCASSSHSTHLADSGLLATAFRSSMPVTGMLIPPRACLLLLISGLSCCYWRMRQLWPLATHAMSCPEDAGGAMGRTTGSLWSRTQPEDCGLCHDAAFLGPRDLASWVATQGPRK